jgi:hypothetical protein
MLMLPFDPFNLYTKKSVGDASVLASLEFRIRESFLWVCLPLGFHQLQEAYQVHTKFCKHKLCCFETEKVESPISNLWIRKCKRPSYIWPQFIQSSFHYIYINYIYVPKENSYNLHMLDSVPFSPRHPFLSYCEKSRIPPSPPPPPPP